MREKYCNNCERILINSKILATQLAEAKAEVESLTKANKWQVDKIESWQEREYLARKERDELKAKLAEAESEAKEWESAGIEEARRTGEVIGNLEKHSAELRAWCEKQMVFIRKVADTVPEKGSEYWDIQAEACALIKEFE